MKTRTLAEKMVQVHDRLCREGYDGSHHHYTRRDYWSNVAMKCQRAERGRWSFLPLEGSDDD